MDRALHPLPADGGDTSCTALGRQNNRGIRKESTKCALAVFKKIVRHVVSVCFVHAEQEFFKPSKLPVHRLLPMGFSNFASCISACILLDPLHEIPMLCALLSMRMGMTIAKRAAWHEGTLEVKPTKLLYRGAPPWRKHKLISNKLEQVAKDSLAKAWPNGLGEDFVCRNFLLYCPGCNADMQAASKRLYHDGKWTSLKCTQCEASRTARRWKCACDIPWPGCEHHGPFGFAVLHARAKLRSREPARAPPCSPLRALASPDPLRPQLSSTPLAWQCAKASLLRKGSTTFWMGRSLRAASGASNLAPLLGPLHSARGLCLPRLMGNAEEPTLLLSMLRPLLPSRGRDCHVISPCSLSMLLGDCFSASLPCSLEDALIYARSHCNSYQRHWQ